MIKSNPCKTCQSTWHTKAFCPQNRTPLKQSTKRIKPMSDKTRAKSQVRDQAWFEQNPPNERGIWFCYLNISKRCEFKLTRSTIQLEHVSAKVRAPELKYDITNLMPSCAPCNSLKQSLSIKELVSFGHSHLQKYL